MNKDPIDKLREDIRRTLQAINDNLLELNDYLARLRAETVAEINAAMVVEDAIPQDVLDALMRARTPGTVVPLDTTDPRRPYQNQRQPRRNGDSFGSVLPTGGTYGTKTEGE